jgi:hypothetical protein
MVARTVYIVVRIGTGKQHLVVEITRWRLLNLGSFLAFGGSLTAVVTLLLLLLKSPPLMVWLVA